MIGIQSQDQDNWSQQPSLKRKNLMKQFDYLSPFKAAIQYAKVLSPKNLTSSCCTTVQLIMQGLSLRGQKVPLLLNQIGEDQKQLTKLVGGLHPQIQQQLRNATYFVIKIVALSSGGGIRKWNTGKIVLSSEGQKKQEKIHKTDVSGDHYILFHKPHSDKDYYQIYHSWQNEFSFNYWMQKSDQFHSISTQLFEEKIFPYIDPLHYLISYFQRIKGFKITQKDTCPKCTDCGCPTIYQFLSDKQLLTCLEVSSHIEVLPSGQIDSQSYQKFKAQIQNYHFKEWTNYITKQQFAWARRLSYFNVLQQYIVF